MLDHQDQTLRVVTGPSVSGKDERGGGPARKLIADRLPVVVEVWREVPVERYASVLLRCKPRREV
jgi:hypothetical protein